MRAVRRSALYDVVVVHRRTAPRPHEVRHELPWWFLELDELDQLDASLTGFGVDRPSLVTFRSRDHLAGNDVPLRDQVEAMLADHGVRLDGGRIALLTQARVAGYVFNPVSFWWCRHADGSLAAVLVEINNTFGERLTHVLVPDPADSTDGVARFEHAKALHVSPFIGLDQRYRYRMTAAPNGSIAVVLEVVDEASPDGAPTLRTSMAGRRRELTKTSALRAAARVSPVRITAAIHLHALRLWRKGAPFRHKPPFVPGHDSLPAPEPTASRT